MFFEIIHGKSAFMKVCTLSASGVILKWRISRRFFNYLLAMVPFSAILAWSVHSRGLFTSAFIAVGAVLFIMSLLTSRLLVFDLAGKKIETGFQVGLSRFTKSIPITSKIGIRVISYRRILFGSSLPIRVPLYQVQLVSNGEKLLVVDESSRQKGMEELSGLLGSLLNEAQRHL